MIDVPLSALEVLTSDTTHPPSDVVSGLLDVARALDRSGYRRVWYAEHHATASLLDIPPAVAVAHAASVTSTIRVGSGGVLAVNHSPLALAEQFGALALFHSGRIDIGIGRGPGTYDAPAARALRRGADPATDEEYRRDVTAILEHLAQRPAAEPWLLASSTAGAALAARLGLPLAFAYHIRPEGAAEAIERYRATFRASRWCATPAVMLAVQVVCAETDAAAQALARPVEIARAAVMLHGGDHPMPDAGTAAGYEFSAAEQGAVAELRSQQVQGSPETVLARLDALAQRFGVDELMLYTPIVDGKDRMRSFELVAGPALP